jgi:hypothetical protein
MRAPPGRCAGHLFLADQVPAILLIASRDLTPDRLGSVPSTFPVRKKRYRAALYAGRSLRRALLLSYSRTLVESMKEPHDSWFHEASARFFTSLWWAVVIIVSGTVLTYLATYFL